MEKLKIVINPAYESLRDFVEELPSSFLQHGETIADGRNIIKKYKVGDLEINVKRYKVPICINRFAYTYIRKSKAYRAYYNAFEIIKRGFETPESVAYIEEYKGGLLNFSFYISLQCPYNREIREFYYGPLQGNEDLFSAFVKYTADLHDKGINHKDYSPGNVLINQDQLGFHFSMVDTNRMSFQTMNMEEGCKNFKRMFINDDIYVFMAKEYAKLRNFDVEKCIELMLKYNHKSIQRDKRKARKLSKHKKSNL